MTNEMIEENIYEALQLVAGWDIPDDQFADAVNQQARLMAGLYIEPQDPFVIIAEQSHLHG